ncbi:MAG: PKD domain-containing protein, partial [Kangiellaceae bacterium]|nr:PKD domain-containing protein [Kangiellaceae bacterium]
MSKRTIDWITIGTNILFSISLLLPVSLSAAEKIDESVNLGGSRQATWYLPDNPSSGWVLLQHGFQRNKSNLDDMATHLMENGLMVLTINSNVSNGNPSLAKDVADDLIDTPPTPPNGIQLPEKLVIVGHSAGGLFVSHLGARLMERNYANLSGAILFDPVDASNALQGNAQSMLDNQVSVLSILANSSSCNSSNNALQPLQNLSAEFVGIKLTDDSKHTDVEGSSTGGIITWLCGTPKSHNIAYVKDYGLHWALDMINQTQTSDYYPGGEKLSQLLSDNDGILIKELTSNPPSAAFAFAVDELSVNFSNQSTDSDGAIVSYEWQFGDGQTSSLENPSHTYDSAGTYTVSLMVTDNDGQTGSISKNVTVTQDSNVPAANFTFSQNGLSVNFTDTSIDA